VALQSEIRPMDGRANLYVTDMGNNRVVKLAAG
jgi:hypothetical protein